MGIKPLHDRVVIRRLGETKTSTGGIVIPDNAAEKPSTGEVVSVGPGKTTENGNVQPLTVKIGQKVLFGKYAGTEVEVKGEDYIVMREDDIMGILE